MLKKLWRAFGPNVLDRKLKIASQAKGNKVLITWNRGLGDIPLGLYALVYRIKEFIPAAEMIFLTRKDLEEGFHLLAHVRVIIAPNWKRGEPFDLDTTLTELNLKRDHFDLILENPDPTHWLKWQLGKLTPKLYWNKDWDLLCEKFHLQKGCVAVHFQTETHYGYEKNWPITHWQQLLHLLIKEKGLQVLLFGFKKEVACTIEGVIDLRGETSLFEMLSIIKNRCAYLVAPDSGVLSITYYLDVNFPIRVVSLWADPRQGVLKQNVSSPNKQYYHLPLLGKNEEIATITVDQVMQQLLC